MSQQTNVVFIKGAAPRLIVRLLFNALGIWIAARLSSNIDYNDSLSVIAIAAVVFTLVNAVIRPIVILFALPAIILTLGVFMLFINGFMVYLTSALYDPFEVSTFGAAMLAAIIIWIVNYGLSMFFASSKLQVGPGSN